jgi:hypothetical protein
MAKLVEILARELKDWPMACGGTYHTEAIAQDLDCGLVRLDHLREPHPTQFNGEDWSRACWTGWAYYAELSEDHATAIVTRAEWQAAVDALKADDCAHSYGSEDGCPECGATKPYSSLSDQEISRITRPAEWDGLGLPPVGTICENVFPGEIWREVIIIAHDEDMAVFRLNNSERLNYFADTNQHFRPIRTPEQIAAERELAELRSIIESAQANGGDIAESILAYGYRKQEPK